MSDNVKALRPELATTLGNAPTESIVVILRDALASAERGEIRGLAISLVRPNGNCCYNHAFEFPWGFTLLAAIDMLHGDFREYIAVED